MAQARVCMAGYNQVHTVPSSTSDRKHLVFIGPYGQNAFNCSCEGWFYHQKCKHVDAIQGELCDWRSDASAPEKQTKTQENMGICPRCGEVSIQVFSTP